MIPQDQVLFTVGPNPPFRKLLFPIRQPSPPHYMPDPFRHDPSRMPPIPIIGGYPIYAQPINVVMPWRRNER